MNRLINLIYFLLVTVLFLISCNSQDQNKTDSKNNVIKAEKILADNKKYNEEDTTADSSILKALTYLEKAIKLDSTNIRAYQDKITVLTILGNRSSDLAETLNRLLELKPDFAEGFLQLGLIYENQKKYDSANLAFRQARFSFLKRKPTDNRNYSLVFVEFLITKSKSATLMKLNELDIKDKEIKKMLILDIDEWVKGNILFN